jgi:hypothetical protein
MGSLLGILNIVLGYIMPVVDKAIPDAAEAEKIKGQITQAVLAGDMSILQSQMQIILAEANGQSWLQRNWRPLLMLICIIIIANNYILAPYVQLIFKVSVMLEMPQALWDLMQVGVGGYLFARSGEKIATSVATILKK